MIFLGFFLKKMGRKIQFLHQVNIGLTLHWDNQKKIYIILKNLVVCTKRIKIVKHISKIGNKQLQLELVIYN